MTQTNKRMFLANNQLFIPLKFQKNGQQIAWKNSIVSNDLEWC